VDAEFDVEVFFLEIVDVLATYVVLELESNVISLNLKKGRTFS
jgi:hypothetical protein